MFLTLDPVLYDSHREPRFAAKCDSGFGTGAQCFNLMADLRAAKLTM